MIFFINCFSCVVYNVKKKMVVLEGEWKMGIFEGSFKTLTKLDRFIFLTFIGDSSLKMIEFRKGYS